MRPETNFDVVSVPIGLLYLSSYIKNVANVKIMDGYIEEISYKEINSFNPDYIGITAYSSEFDKVKELIKKLRICTDAIIILGGSIAYNSNKLDADIAIKGEGEIILKNILENNIKKGIFESVPLENLDSISLDLGKIDLNKYYEKTPFGNLKKKQRNISIVTSRGCPYSCIYCGGHLNNGKRWRAKSPVAVINEIKKLNSDYGIGDFQILDDVFNLDMNRAKNIFRLIIDSELKVGISFPNGIRVDRVDEEMIQLMKEAGVYKLSYGIESGSNRIQKLIKKNLDLDLALKNIELTTKEGLITQGFFMVGFPTETEEEFKETLAFALKSKLDYASFHRVLSFEGTELFEMTGVSSINADYNHSKYNFSKIENVDKTIKRAKIRFYLSKGRYKRILKEKLTQFKRNMKEEECIPIPK